MQEITQNKMAVKPVGSLLITMGLPIMISMMVQALYNVVDSIFISRVSEDALTAVSLAFPIQILMISAGVGSAIGINALLSRKLGARKYHKASQVALNGLFIAVVLGILFAIIGAILSPIFFYWFTSNEEIAKMGQTYLLICTLFSLGIFGQIVCERIMQGTGDTIHPMITQGAGAIINIILDPILIFGYFGFPALGVAGAAIATVIGQWVAMLLAFSFMRRKTKELQFSFKGFKPDRKIIFDIYRVGFPSIIMQSIGSIMTVGMNTILIAFSSTAVALFGIYFKLQSFIFMPVFGLVSAMISIVAYNYGARDKRRITAAVRMGVLIASVVMILGMLTFQFLPRLLLSFFNASDEMMDMGIGALRKISIHFPLAAIGIMLSSSFQALGKGTYSLYMSIIRQLGVLLPAAFLLSHLFGFNSLWYAFIISEVVSLILSLILYRRIYRNKIRGLIPLTQEL